MTDPTAPALPHPPPAANASSGAGMQLTVVDAARLLHVSDDTIRRRIAHGVFPNAWRDPTAGGAWRIPATDITVARSTATARPAAAGRNRRCPHHPAATAPRHAADVIGVDVDNARHVVPLADHLAAVADLQALAVRAARAEALAEARAAHIDDLRTQLHRTPPHPPTHQELP